MTSLDRVLPGLSRLALLPPCCGEGALAEAAYDAPRALRLTSPAFRNGAPLPPLYSSTEGQNVSPPLAWGGIPPRARELALLCEDPDARATTPFVHWTLYRLSPTVHRLPEGLGPDDGPLGAVQGKNSRHRDGYDGPAPPRGSGVHHYHFQLFALDAPLDLGPHADRDTLTAAMLGHVLALGELVGTYERP
ncbi:MAG TPA: YbhB/YbcL family Raf kinase inhibitor-like protein [Polyangiaceae bacterium]|nr:YbhB/YbcL family Raf kinase inhibitor-like protein [Polyangiaceae bacterium]